LTGCESLTDVGERFGFNSSFSAVSLPASLLKLPNEAFRGMHLAGTPFCTFSQVSVFCDYVFAEMSNIAEIDLTDLMCLEKIADT
jgi:hypothetical protein